MRHRVEEVLLVASPYDAFILEEDGRLHELILSEALDHAPALTAVASGGEALERAREGERFRLAIATLHVGDMNAAALARRAAELGLALPVVLLAYDGRELTGFASRHDLSALEAMFLWQGDARLLPAIVKLVEDRRNAPHDAREAGVPVILLVEDSVRYYSSFLPAIYGELAAQSQRLLPEGMNLSHKILRMRARPKILLSRTYEEAWRDFTAYEEAVLGIVSDVEFPRDGVWSSEAGIDLARAVRERVPDVPVVLQSSRPENAIRAHDVGASFLLKGSPVLLNELRRFMVEYFGLGDFVFRLPDGREVDRARDLRDLEEKLRIVPAASLAYHGERNHFSKWLKAHTEFEPAEKLRPRKVSDFATHEELRRSLIDSIAEYRREQSQATVADFDRQAFDGTAGFTRIGGGSLGGKARGLAFVRALLYEHGLAARFPGVEIAVPGAAILGTDVFDQFLDENSLRHLAIHATGDAEIEERFRAAPFPEAACEDLAAFLTQVREPLAVRSSSLLEDSPDQPFTGVYVTRMLANDDALPARLEKLVEAIKAVYASTFSQHAKAYLKATSYRLEEEKMAVLLQRIVGARHGDRFYPDIAGVARSHNFYPSPPLLASDGIVAAGLGLGRTVVEGGECVRFSPRHPRLAQVEPQREFWALDLRLGAEARFGLDAAEADGTLAPLASTWSPENDTVSDGIARTGIRLVTLAPVLKQGLFPLAAILEALMEIGTEGMSAPVEIEFAVNLSTPPGRPKEFGFLQMRPLALSRETEELDLGEERDEELVCRSAQVLGNGRIEGISDVVVVDVHRFDRARSREAAREIARLNARLLAGAHPYVLIGVGRWGSSDPWLGIPVTWDEISGARAVVEAGLRDLPVVPSQGSHFFQNLTSFHVGYFTVNGEAAGAAREGFVDWEWLAAQPALYEAEHVRHLRLAAPLVVKMNGKKGEGVIVKPVG